MVCPLNGYNQCHATVSATVFYIVRMRFRFEWKSRLVIAVLRVMHTGDKYTSTGPYLITDNGYAKWRIMQCPIKFRTNESELRWSSRLESVRKDVEYYFGRLKAGFRILQSNNLFHHQHKVDNVFISSSILHNMNLVHDGLNIAWKDPANWETPEDEDETDIRESRERLRMRGRLVTADVVLAAENIRRVVVEDIEDLKDASYIDFRKKLIDYYVNSSDNNLVEWI